MKKIVRRIKRWISRVDEEKVAGFVFGAVIGCAIFSIILGIIL